MNQGNGEGKEGDRKDRKEEARSLYRKQEGDSHHHGSSVVHSSVFDLQQWWVVGHCCSVDNDDAGNGDHGDNGPFSMLSKWSSQLSLEYQLKSKVVESTLLGVAASSSGISAGNSFVPIFLALPADKREQGGANLYLAFTGYNGIIPQSPIANRSYLVTGQIFCQ